jgi:hypothetical protein
MVTAVEWMFDKLLEEGPSGELRWHLKHDIFKILEQAKAMEKEQIMEAYNNGEDRSAELYYNETYETSNI